MNIEISFVESADFRYKFVMYVAGTDAGLT